MPKDLRKEITKFAALCKQWAKEDAEKSTLALSSDYATGYYGGNATAFRIVSEMLEITLNETK